MPAGLGLPVVVLQRVLEVLADLRVARALLDVVADDRDVAEVERGVDLVHHVQRRRLVVVEREDEREAAQRLLAAGEVADVLPALLLKQYWLNPLVLLARSS